MPDDHREFFTVRGYAMQDQVSNDLTPGMEDYLEMIFRLSEGNNYTRINDLAGALNVQPPSATRMVQKLAEVKCVKYQRYGMIEMTVRGRQLGAILLERHKTLENFLRFLGVQINVLDDTEKIEHYLSHETLQCIIKFVEFVQINPGFMKPYQQYVQKNG